MRILITGVAGQVGNALVARLGKHELVPVDRSKLDLAELSTLKQRLGEYAPDLIINPAAYTDVDRAETDPGLASRVNGEAPGVMAQWAATRGVPLIHFSTDYVFDGSGYKPWRESDETTPLSVYGKSKLEGEQAVCAAGGPSLIIRTSWVYAAKGQNFLRTIVRLAREREQLRIVADQTGAPTPAALIADVLNQILIDGLEKFLQQRERCRGIMHLAAAGETSWYAFACAIVEGLKKRGVAIAAKDILAIRTRDYPTAAQRPQNSRLDLSTLRTVFAISPPHWFSALEAELDKLALHLRAEP